MDWPRVSGRSSQGAILDHSLHVELLAEDPQEMDDLGRKPKGFSQGVRVSSRLGKQGSEDALRLC